MPTTAMSPLEQLIGERMKVRVARAPSLVMTAFVGGAIGAAVGLATGVEGRGSALRYGALGAALGLAGSFAYSIYNTRSATEQALAEHQALLAASTRPAPAPARAAQPRMAAPHHAGGLGRAGWSRGMTSALHLSPYVPTYPNDYSYPWQ